MPKSVITMPSLQRRLKELGENIHLARLRRRLPATRIAERAGLSRQTLSAIEHGDPSVTIGAYASVLLVLGLDADLTLVAADDILGRKLQEANLTVKKRAPRRPKSAFQSSPIDTTPLPIDVMGGAGNKE